MLGAFLIQEPVLLGRMRDCNCVIAELVNRVSTPLPEATIVIEPIEDMNMLDDIIG